MGQEFICFFCGGVKAQWMIDGVANGKRELGIGSVDAARRRIDQMLDGMVPAGLQYGQKANNIGIDEGLWIFNRPANARLCREMHNA